MKRAIFPGSFDPFTIGHYAIVQRGLTLFDEIVIGVGINSSKKTLFSAEQRLKMIKQAFAHEPRVSIQAYECLTIDFAQSVHAQFILRGLRTGTDFEYERSIADANRALAGIETITLFTEEQHSFVSSTLLRDLLRYSKDVQAFLPPNVILPQPDLR